MERCLGGGVISYNMHPDDVRVLMTQPWTMTSSDGAYPVFGAIWEDQVAGFVQTPSPADYTWNVERWYRADR